MGMMDNLGFSGKPETWAGKTIAVSEVIKMQWGSVSDFAILFKFTDGTRGWVMGRPASNMMVGPDIDALEKSQIITADEYGALVAARKREKDARAEEEKRRKRQELERLKKELGE